MPDALAELFHGSRALNDYSLLIPGLTDDLDLLPLQLRNS
jgi:hypothetical protein